ncbi:MAG: hypothetical protein MJ126_09800 [Lachnospiraceae bacterium]|nr:hypothetical protein [Lachnospiraceae bacterium]
MKEKLIYSIIEIRDLCGNVVSYEIDINHKAIAIVSKEDGENAIRAIKKNGKFYNYEVRTTSTGRLYWTFYFEIGNKLPEPVESKDDVKGTRYGHCRCCGGKTFVTIPRVPGSIFYEEGELDMMCKSCGRIITCNDIVYWEW